MTAVLIVVSALLVALGAARIAVWVLDRNDARLHAQLRAQQLLADAELEADLQRLEDAWRMQDECNCEYCVRGRAEAREADHRG